MSPVEVKDNRPQRKGGRADGPSRSLGAARFAERFGLVFIWAVLVLVFSLLEPSTYATTQNAQTILSSQSVLLILAIASLPPLIAGELDLSVAGVLGISMVLVGFLNIDQGWPIIPAIAVAILAGVLVGLINSTVIVVVGVDSIVATLGMGTLLPGIALGITQSPFTGVSQSLVDVTGYKILGIQAAFYMALLVCVIAWFSFQHLPAGRRLYFVGAGREVARLSGIRVDLFRAAALISASTLSAIGGVILTGLLGSADPTVGNSLLLPALAAAFLGATAITPGRFNVWGTFIAAYFLVSGITGLIYVGLAGWISQVFYGGALIIAVVLSKLAGMRTTASLGERVAGDSPD